MPKLKPKLTSPDWFKNYEIKVLNQVRKCRLETAHKYAEEQVADMKMFLPRN